MKKTALESLVDPGSSSSATEVDGLARETALAAVVFLLFTMFILRFPPLWARGVLGGGDAWLNTWNIAHVRAWLSGAEPLFYSQQVWAPSGCGLWLDTLILPGTIPAAVLSQFVGLTTTYNVLVVFSLVLAGVATYRLGRRLGIGVPAAFIAGATFAFAPQMMGRTMGHLNLLGTGWFVLGAECYLAATRARARAPILPATASALALIVLVYWDWYLAILGFILMTVMTASESLDPIKRRRAIVLSVGIGSTAVIASAPLLFAILSHHHEFASGHRAELCCVPLTSLFIPSQVQLIAAAVPSLVSRTTQNMAEGATYLGFIPLVATVWAVARGWGGRLCFALWAGCIALVLSLGPHLRLFDTITGVPLPYLLLEKALPFLKTGGCVTRFELLTYLPLALGTGAAADLLLRSGTRLSRVVLVIGLGLLAVEYAPKAPGIDASPRVETGSPVARISSSPEGQNVLDLGWGPRALARQLSHNHKLTVGYLPRMPKAASQERARDPVLGPLLKLQPLAQSFDPRAAAFRLRHGWGIGWVLAPMDSPLVTMGERFGLQHVAEDGEVTLFSVPNTKPAPCGTVSFDASDDDLAALGVILRGFYRPEQVGIPGRKVGGRWTEGHASVIVPGLPGRWEVHLAAPRPGAPVTELWVEGRRKGGAPVDREAIVTLTIEPEDLQKDGALKLDLSTPPFTPSGSRRSLGIFVTVLHGPRAPD